MKTQLFAIMAFMAMAAASSAQTADHLLISEVAIAGQPYDSGTSSPEFVELFNPTGAAVTDLDKYYLTDWSQYWRWPEHVKNGTLPDEGGADYVATFPTGTTLPPSGVVTVTANAQNFLRAYFDDPMTSPTDYGVLLSRYNAQAGAPLLFEMTDSLPTVPNMVNRSAATVDGLNLGHTDSGENVFLYHYDGTSDLVKDVDMVMYKKRKSYLGYDNGFWPIDAAVDGPDADITPTAYAVNKGTEDNVAVQYVAGNMYNLARRTAFEPGEIATGGNGLTGHDETTEEARVAFEALDTTNTATPGRPHAQLVAADKKPVIYNAVTVPPTPTSTTPFEIRATIWDDGSISSAIAYIVGTSGTNSYPMTYTGSNNVWSVTIPAGTYANKSTISWYIEATDNTSNLTSELEYSDYDPTASTTPYVHKIGVDDAPALGSIVINEIQFDPSGTDNGGTAAEFIELYNTSPNSIDLTGYKYQYNTSAQITLPSGSIIAGNDYLVLAYNVARVNQRYAGITSKVKALGSNQTASVLANSGTGTIYLYSWDNETLVDKVSYRVTPAWPGNTVSGSNYAASNTGFPIELVNPSLDNDNGMNWIVSSKLRAVASNHGTPGFNNFSIDCTRDIVYPKPTDTVKITARVAGTVAPTSAPSLGYSVDGGAVTTVTMSLDSFNVYSANIGPFSDRAFITYNVWASAGSSDVLASPLTPYSFQVTTQGQIPDTKVIITEVMVSPVGVDNAAGNSEWIELYNTTASPLNLGNVLVGPDTPAAGAMVTIPEGVVIQPHGYLVVAGNKTSFLTQYPAVDPNLVIDAGWTTDRITDAGSQRLGIIDPNQVAINRTNFADDIVDYDNTWPYFTMSNDDPPVRIEGNTMELKEPFLDNNVKANWSVNTSGGTPAGLNSNSSAVNDWSIY